MIHDAISSLSGLVFDLITSVVLAVVVYITVKHVSILTLTMTFLALGLWFRYFTHLSILIKERNNAAESSNT
jgi:hypothetical protein